MKHLSILPRSKYLLADSLMAIAIILSPVIFYSYLCFPETEVWETPLFTYQSYYYQNVHTFMWVLSGKLFWLFQTLLWYFTNRNWWRHCILVSISMSLWQIMVLANDDIFLKDDALDLWIMLPVIFAFCVLLYFFRRKVVYYSGMLDLKDEFEKEIKAIEKDSDT